MWWTHIGSFYSAAPLKLREREKKKGYPICVGIHHDTNHNRVSFHFSPPPIPWKNSPREERERGPTYSWNHHDWVVMCSAFHVRKMVYFHFPLCEFLHLKDPNNFPLTKSTWQIFPWEMKRVSIFLLWGSGDCLQNENVSPFTQTQQLMCEMKWVGPTLFHAASRIKFPTSGFRPREPARQNLVTSQGTGRPLLSANRSPVARRGLQLVTCA